MVGGEVPAAAAPRNGGGGRRPGGLQLPAGPAAARCAAPAPRTPGRPGRPRPPWAARGHRAACSGGEERGLCLRNRVSGCAYRAAGTACCRRVARCRGSRVGVAVGWPGFRDRHRPLQGPGGRPKHKAVLLSGVPLKPPRNVFSLRKDLHL